MRLRHLPWLLAIFAFAQPGIQARPDQAAPEVRAWSFDTEKPGNPPAGFTFGRTGEGRPGRWIMQADTTAPSGSNALAQVDADDTDYRFPVAVVEDVSLRDLRLSVKCKAVSGKVDQACGLVFRYRDANNYYITRANALEGNIRLYYVKDGKRKQIASFKGPVTANKWHDYRVEAKGSHIEVFWDGKPVLSGDDRTFPEAGRIGLWTKADSVSYFDDLAVTPLEAEGAK